MKQNNKTFVSIKNVKEICFILLLEMNTQGTFQYKNTEKNPKWLVTNEEQWYI